MFYDFIGVLLVPKARKASPTRTAGVVIQSDAGIS